MKKLSGIFFLAFITLAAFAQKEISYDSLTDIHQYQIQGQLYDYRIDNQQNSHRTVAIKGTAFLYNQWQNGTIPLQNNRRMNVPLNYNIIEDYLVIYLADEEKTVYPEVFTINDRTFIRINKQYFEALYLGKNKLLRRHIARLDKVERNGYNENIRYDYEYSKNEDLFLQQDDGSLVAVKLNERSLLSKLPDYQTARTIVKNQNLNMRSEKDVITLLTSLEQ